MKSGHRDGGIRSKDRSRPFGTINFNPAIPAHGGQGAGKERDTDLKNEVRITKVVLFV